MTPKVAQHKPRQREEHSHNTFNPAYSSLLAAATAPSHTYRSVSPRVKHYPTGDSNDYGSLHELPVVDIKRR